MPSGITTIILGAKPTLGENSEFDVCHPWRVPGTFPFLVHIDIWTLAEYKIRQISL